MKDLLAKLDALHAKATPGEWKDNGGDIVANSASYVQTITIVGFDHGGDEEDLEAIVALHNRWKEVRAYIAGLEKAAGYADSMLDLAAERGVEYDIARECLDRALCEVGIR